MKFPCWDWIQPQTIEEYEKSLVRYFSMPHELDALLFQNRKVHDEWSEYVVGLLDKAKINLLTFFQ